MKTFFSLLLVLTLNQSLAAPKCEDLKAELQQDLESFYWNTSEDTGYRPYRCETNAFRMADWIVGGERGYPIEVVAVWKYQDGPRKNWLRITPSRPRQPNALWAYHVFVVVDGLILDPDFETTPRVIEFKKYLEDMYQEVDGAYWFASWPFKSYRTSEVGRYSPTSEMTVLLSRSEIIKKFAQRTNCAE